jgi:protein-S-isoprenylcysteine O-methyltransferase Ste14
VAAWVIRLYVVYLLLAFGLRGAAQRYRTGSSGFNGIPLHGSVAEWSGGVLLIFGFVLAVLAPVLDRAGRVGPIAALDGGVGHAIGFALYTLGVAGTLYAQFAMGASWRVGVDASERTVLVTSGPFAAVRNPIYTSMIVAVVGLALLVPNLAAVAAVAVVIVALEIHVRAVEEPYLVRSHGAPYTAYAARTGRFLPGIGTLRQ